MIKKNYWKLWALVIILSLGIHCKVRQQGFGTYDRRQDIYCQIQQGGFWTIGARSIKFMDEGLLCKNSNLSGDNRTLFIDYFDLNLNNIIVLKEHLTKVYNRYNDSFYQYETQVIGLPFIDMFTLTVEGRYYHFGRERCYLAEMDTIILLINELIPEGKRKNYELETSFNYRESCPCNVANRREKWMW